MSQPVVPAVIEARSITRVRVFVDYWNFQLTMNSLEASASGQADYVSSLTGRA